MDAASKRLILIDGTAYAYRSFHAIRDTLSTREGIPTNAVFGFAKSLLRLLNESQPKHIAIVFDAPGPTVRHQMYSEYKANRPETQESFRQQMPLIKRFVNACRISTLEHPGVEADDVLATLALKAAADGFEVQLYSNDKDMFQIVSDQIHVYRAGYSSGRPDSEEFRVYDPQAVRKRYGVAPKQMADFLAIVGDTSDNVPGAKGIGEKTAPDLLQEFGSVEGLIQNLDAVPARWQQKVADSVEILELSKRLVTLDTDVPVGISVDALEWQGRDDQALFELFQELEFVSMLSDLSLEPDQPETSYHTVLTDEALEQLVTQLGNVTCFAVDLETTSLNTLDAELVGISISFRAGEAYYIPTGHRYLGAPSQLSEAQVLDALRPFLESPDVAKVGQNIKYDLKVLNQHGVEVQGISFDTLIASYVLNPSATGNSLDSLALRYLNRKMIPITELIGKGSKQITMDQADLEETSTYACEDAEVTFLLMEKLENELREQELHSIFADIEMPLIRVLAEMETLGIQVDLDYLQQVSLDLATRLRDMSRDIYEIAGEEFNIKSPKQLGTILFDKLKLPTRRRTKTGYSTDERTLRSLVDKHPLPQLILDYRQLATLKSTFVDALPTHVHPRTGRVHTSFNQAVATTGRLSSSDPNLQNIPIRTEEGKALRRAFVAAPGQLLIAADYSQIELRILAHISGDANLTEAFRSGQDVHARTASLIFGYPLDAVPSEVRSQAKTINFGIIYGLSAYSLARDLGIPVPEAQEFIDNYFKTYPGVRDYLDLTTEIAKQQGYVTTLLGRRRYVPEIHSSNHNTREFGKRSAINAPIQGTAADMIKLAMLQVAKYLDAEAPTVRMLLQVHDELVFEIPEEDVGKVQPRIQEIMEQAYPLNVPVKVDAHSGTNWLEAK